MHWVFDAPDSASHQDVATAPLLLNLFEIYPEDYEGEERASIESSAIYPDFVRDFSKQRNFVSISYEEFLELSKDEDWPQPFVSPPIEPEPLALWARAWVKVLSDCDDDSDDIKDAFELRSRGFDWTAEVIEDLQNLQRVAERAVKVGSTLHIEIS